MRFLGKRNKALLVLTSFITALLTYLISVVIISSFNIDFNLFDIRIKIVVWTVATVSVYSIVHRILRKWFLKNGLHFYMIELHIMNFLALAVLGFLIIGTLDFDYITIMGSMLGFYVICKNLDIAV